MDENGNINITFTLEEKEKVIKKTQEERLNYQSLGKILSIATLIDSLEALWNIKES